uniref:Uncharacterized protein n=1 Tax=Compsopogon caeruleus TaxID=31354 RepID=A0A7S1XCS7_9RHOD|mmetsp:Transcript_15470/g.31315  ORF Transcript_15470/g.31315 Transcript_15470/m.31315 type:complete len:112 (+) Transcript_15470:709-1044(+)
MEQGKKETPKGKNKAIHIQEPLPPFLFFFLPALSLPDPSSSTVRVLSQGNHTPKLFGRKPVEWERGQGERASQGRVLGFRWTSSACSIGGLTKQKNGNGNKRRESEPRRTR